MEIQNPWPLLLGRGYLESRLRLSQPLLLKPQISYGTLKTLQLSKSPAGIEGGTTNPNEMGISLG